MAQTIYCQKVIEKNTTHLGFKGLKGERTMINNRFNIRLSHNVVA